MFTIPDPLHPAIVHFPIVLLLLGAPLAVVAVFIRKWQLPLLAAVVLALGGAGAIAATWSGGKDAEMAFELSGNGDATLDEHEEWGERTRNVAILAAVLAAASAALFRKPKAGMVIGALAALAAIGAAYCVAETGHYGGRLVYKHGAGVNTAAGEAEAEAGAAGKDHDGD